jgi:Xaa-Pro aminopeptidase
MDAWEYPWLTPGSSQEVREGDVIACEPGLYCEKLGGGFRLEHNYLIGKDGATPLDNFPLDL